MNAKGRAKQGVRRKVDGRRPDILNYKLVLTRQYRLKNQAYTLRLKPYTSFIL